MCAGCDWEASWADRRVPGRGAARPSALCSHTRGRAAWLLVLLAGPAASLAFEGGSEGCQRVCKLEDPQETGSSDGSGIARCGPCAARVAVGGLEWPGDPRPPGWDRSVPVPPPPLPLPSAFALTLPGPIKSVSAGGLARCAGGRAAGSPLSLSRSRPPAPVWLRGLGTLTGPSGPVSAASPIRERRLKKEGIHHERDLRD